MGKLNEMIGDGRLHVLIVFLVMFLPITIVGASYTMKYDQHYVDTVNERAMSYTSDNSTSTDFAEGIILMNDADGDYESKVFYLDNPELYYFMWGLIGLALTFAPTLIAYMEWVN